MRTLFVGIAVIVGACSSSDDTPSSPAGMDAGTSGTSSSSSSGAVSDASTTNEAGTDGGSCSRLGGGTYDKTCAVAGDCLMLARGCYCGAQPITGVSKSAQPAAQQCETEAGQRCALGCANAPGHVADDGKNDEGTGKNIEVFCDNGQCKTRLP